MSRAACGKAIICCAKLATEAEAAALPTIAAQARQVDANLRLSLELEATGFEPVYTEDEVLAFIRIAERQLEQVRRYAAAGREMQDAFSDQLVNVIRP